MEMPKTIGVAVDQLYKLRSSRLAAEKKIDELKSRERSLRDHILVMLNQAKLERAGGRIAMASKAPKLVYKLAEQDGWKKFWHWARRDPLGVYVQKRIAAEALTEYIDTTKKVVPGIEPLHIVDLSLTKKGASHPKK